MIRPQNIKILVSHEDNTWLEMMTRRFQIFGFNTLSTPQIHEAQYRIEKEPQNVDVFLAHLPAKKMSENHPLPHWIETIKKQIPFQPKIFVLTDDVQQLIQSLLNLGADGVLHHTLNMRLLIQLSRKALLSNRQRWQMPPNFQTHQSLIEDFGSLSKALEKKLLKIGRGGFCLRSTTAVGSVDSFVRIKIRARPLELTGIAQVIWQKFADKQCLTGFEFVHLSGGSAANVTDWITDNSVSSYIPSDF